ncbi:hypothetical protein B0E33_06660 [Roseibium algicola]|jgi:hypothetical protein|uniref:Uncharacterized protein n=1 Tax=Roseibium algicola TaxID=2857014 RepID=A0ABN4WT90_9HYPH|nr:MULTISPECIES: hypothetical protein [Stappiaceae]MCR9281555.1 hypothetical protein [Paracoccaceae bacterium]MEC9403812.1 hypothetical protein [Pseudomonadota bacterium]AQQ03312.1 hypothetical protein B0E33_06660 [Roseibium aggregatum]ERP88675.1 hypothetical protein Q669_09455 [Labrenzia sp. C1B10]MBO6856204.1 hypothetical protein [Roseibium sp.]
MAQSMRQTASDQYENADQLNRTIAQDAQTDQELESQVPPVSRYGTIWRVAAVIILLLALLTSVVFLA